MFFSLNTVLQWLGGSSDTDKRFTRYLVLTFLLATLLSLLIYFWLQNERHKHDRMLIEMMLIVDGVDQAVTTNHLMYSQGYQRRDFREHEKTTSKR